MFMHSTLYDLLGRVAKELLIYSKHLQKPSSRPGGIDAGTFVRRTNAAQLCLSFHACAAFLRHYLAEKGCHALCEDASCMRTYEQLALTLETILAKPPGEMRTTQLLQHVHVVGVMLLKVAPSDPRLVELCSFTAVTPRILRLVGEQMCPVESMHLLTLATLSTMKMPVAHVHGNDLFVAAV